MTKKRSRRRTRINWGWIDLKTRWGSAELEFGTWKDGVRHEVIVEIKNPWEIAYIRSKLDEIIVAWEKDLQQAKKP